jgi:hypothetical protein
LREPCGVLRKFPRECWARARCLSPLEMKNGSKQLLGPKHVGPGRCRMLGRMPTTRGVRRDNTPNTSMSHPTRCALSMGSGYHVRGHASWAQANNLGPSFLVANRLGCGSPSLWVFSPCKGFFPLLKLSLSVAL